MPLLDITFIDQTTGHPNKADLRRFGPSFQVIVGHYASPDPADTPPQVETVWALVDTGACESFIDSDLAKKLDLPVIDTTQISGVGGMATHDVYLAHINNVGLEFSQFGRFAGVHLTNGGQPHGVLLGRTFLENVMMVYDGIRGQVTLTAARIR